MKHRWSRRGNSAVEFALVLPMLASLVLGVIEISLYFLHVSALQQAARDGARVGQITLEGSEPDGTQIRATAAAQARDVLAENGLDCGANVTCNLTTEWVELHGDGRFWLVLDVAVPFSGMTGIMAQFSNPSATFRVLTQEQPPPTP